MRVPCWFLGFATLLLTAQTPAPPAAKYQFKGKPVPLPFTCAAEHFDQFDLPCTADAPCPIYLELSGVASAATKLFVTGNFHTSSVTLASLLLASDDEGHTWTEPWPRSTGAGLEQIQFFDFATGWISGEVLSSPPRDPFLLLTTDGGATWHRRPVFSESRPGTIDKFSFDDAKQGNLLIDRIRPSEEGHRYELYQTRTGGESWSVSQVSREPLHLPKPPSENRGFRVRADSPSKSYVVEQQAENQRWHALASFLIDAGKCRPPEPQ